jgi:hypothetical protein
MQKVHQYDEREIVKVRGKLLRAECNTCDELHDHQEFEEDKAIGEFCCRKPVDREEWMKAQVIHHKTDGSQACEWKQCTDDFRRLRHGVPEEESGCIDYLLIRLSSEPEV